MGTILLILVVILVLAAIPAWPYSREWGYAPMGGMGLLLAVILLLVFAGIIPVSFNTSALTDVPEVNINSR